MEDKKMILNELVKLLQLCEINVVEWSLFNEGSEETVLLVIEDSHYNKYYKYINVTGDSGKAMIGDIIGRL